ncbi:MAG: hypothetical protein ACXVUE_22670 [Solirubrobacteraceae bacterium]
MKPKDVERIGARFDEFAHILGQHLEPGPAESIMLDDGEHLGESLGDRERERFGTASACVERGVPLIGSTRRHRLSRQMIRDDAELLAPEPPCGVPDDLPDLMLTQERLLLVMRLIDQSAQHVPEHDHVTWNEASVPEEVALQVLVALTGLVRDRR